MKSENEWYASKEHFETEESYEEYVQRKKKDKLKSSLRVKIPSEKDLLKGTFN